MFTKKPDAAAGADAARAISPIAPARPAAPPPLAVASRPMVAAAAASVIGPDLAITGNLQSKGEIQIEGQVQGDLAAARIVVGPGARITGGIIADDVIVQGTVMGSIRGNRVTLQSSSKVEGDIFHQSLAIEQGAYFEGKSRRAEDPTARPAGEFGHSLPNGATS